MDEPKATAKRGRARREADRSLDRMVPARAVSSAGSSPSMGEIGLSSFAPYLLNRIAARWNADMAEALRGFDMTTTKMRVLAVLSISSGLTVNELSVFAVTEQSTMSRTLDSMEEQGFIRRRPREGDLRVREIFVTEAGRDAFDEVWPTMYAKFSDMFEGVDEGEYQALISTLHKVLANIRRHDL